MIDIPANAALIVMYVQEAFDLLRWGARNNLEAERNIARLLSAWRKTGRSVIHGHHESSSPTGVVRKGEPEVLIEPEALPEVRERFYWKAANSAFIGMSLEAA